MPEGSKHKSIFKEAAADFRVDPLEATWDKIYPRLGRKLFFKFSFTRFNVFYLSAMMAMAGYASYTTWENIRLKTEIKQLFESSQSELLLIDSVSIGNTDVNRILYNQQKGAGYEVVSGTQNSPLLQNKEGNIDGTDNLAIEAGQVTVASDTVSHGMPEQENTNGPIDVTATQTTPLRQKTVIKKVVVIKPEPVVVRDTVVVKKKNTSKSKK